MSFISFCYLIAIARTSSSVLNSCSKSRHPRLVPDRRGKSSQFFPIEDDVNCGVFIDGLYCVDVCSL